MIKLKDLLCYCTSDVHIMSGPISVLIISKSLNHWRWISSEMLNAEIKTIIKTISSYDSYIKVWLKTGEDEND